MTAKEAAATMAFLTFNAAAKEARAAMPCGEGALRRAIESGRVEAYRAENGFTYVKRESLDEWLAAPGEPARLSAKGGRMAL